MRRDGTLRDCTSLVLLGRLALLALVGCDPAAAPLDPAPDVAARALADTSRSAAGAKICQGGAYALLRRSDGTAFATEGACVSWLARGGRLAQTVAFGSTNPTPVRIDDPTYAPSATASSGLPVVITLDATSTGCSLAGGVVSFLAAGTCRVDANQPGDAVWAPAPEATQAITIDRKTQTITFTSTNPSPVHVGDAPYTPQATASSGLPVVITLDATSTGCTLVGGVVAFTSAGTCRIDADQAGDAVYAPATQGTQSITVTVSPAAYCASIGGTYGGATATALWTCNGWTASSLEDASDTVDPLVDACRADNGLVTGPLDYSYTLPFPTTVNARCHLPPG